MKKPQAVSATVESNQATLCPRVGKTRAVGCAASNARNIGPMPPATWMGRYRPRNTMTARISTSLISAMEAGAWMPETTT